MRLIDADALKKSMFSYYDCVNEHSGKHNYSGDTLMDYEVADLIEDCIDNATTIEAEPVKCGRWERQEDDECYWYECSECHNPPAQRFKRDYFSDYCPNCGSKMDEEATHASD